VSGRCSQSKRPRYPPVSSLSLDNDDETKQILPSQGNGGLESAAVVLTQVEALLLISSPSGLPNDHEVQKASLSQVDEREVATESVWGSYLVQ
jgi:hypothetical protein